jgi:hypothetical protein
MILNIVSSINTIILIVLLNTVFLSCSRNIRELPVETSFGKLISVEIKKRIETDEEKINPEPGTILYLLSFEGGDTISFVTYARTRDVTKALAPILETVRFSAPLVVDLKTKIQYIPVFIGMKDHTGKIIAPIIWEINAECENYTWRGTLVTNTGGITLVYLIPEEVGNFSIKDHENIFRISQ